jgi:AraC-like DNA-binding protein
MPDWSSSRAAASAELKIHVASEFGISRARCIARTGIPDDGIADPAREIQGWQELRVLRNILRALPPGVPFPLLAGSRYHSSTHGMWGFAVLSAPTLRAAIEVGLRYVDLTYSFSRVRFEVDGREGRLFYDDSDNPDDLRAALVECELAALVSMVRDHVQPAVPFLSLQLRSAPPDYVAAFEPLFGVMPRFNSQVNRVTLDVAVLDTPQRMADELGLRVCEIQCQALLEKRAAQSGIAGRVRSRILRHPGKVPTMETVAAELNMTTRTLRNRLAVEATSFRELVEKVREELAEQLLSTELSVDAIAERLGYADTSSFTAAFKRWKGVPPRGYRGDVSGGFP